MTSSQLEPIRVEPDGVKVYQVGELEVPNYARMPKQLQSMVMDVAAEVGADADDVAMRIMAEILDAPTLEDTLNQAEVTHGGDLIGKVFTIHDVKWNRSNVGKGLPFYAVLDITAVGGSEHHLATTSATNVMAQVWKFKREGWLPVDVRLDESTNPTPDGYRPQRLVPPDSAEPF